jgi:hypothetical protein
VPQARLNHKIERNFILCIIYSKTSITIVIDILEFTNTADIVTLETSEYHWKPLDTTENHLETSVNYPRNL